MNETEYRRLRNAVYNELRGRFPTEIPTVDDVIDVTLDVVLGPQYLTEEEMDDLVRMLEDQALLESDELQESLEQMRRGEGEVVRANPSSQAEWVRPAVVEDLEPGEYGVNDGEYWPDSLTAPQDKPSS